MELCGHIHDADKYHSASPPPRLTAAACHRRRVTRSGGRVLSAGCVRWAIECVRFLLYAVATSGQATTRLDSDADRATVRQDWNPDPRCTGACRVRASCRFESVVRRPRASERDGQQE